MKKLAKTQYSKNEDHGILSHHFMANRREKVEAVTDFIFLGSKILQTPIETMKLKDTCSLEGKL